MASRMKLKLLMFLLKHRRRLKYIFPALLVIIALAIWVLFFR